MLPMLELPESLNYFSCFLTFGCDKNCSYCINDPEQSHDRGKFYPLLSAKAHNGLTPEQWIEALSRVPVRPDLPITMAGGEPTLYYSGKGLGQIIKGIPHYVDVLTNFATLRAFRDLPADHRHKLQRDVPYPSIRVSWHPEQMDDFEGMLTKFDLMREYGFDISSDISKSDAALYMVQHPLNPEPPDTWRGRVAFEKKEFLGTHEGKLYGTYKYPYSTDLVSSGVWHRTLKCDCFSAECLVDPQGFVHRCHKYLYEIWSRGGLAKEFRQMVECDFKFVENEDRVFGNRQLKPIGHILDPEFSLHSLSVPRVCYRYGECIGCDTKSKIKTYREGEEYVKDRNYSSVQITNIEVPPELKDLF